MVATQAGWQCYQAAARVSIFLQSPDQTQRTCFVFALYCGFVWGWVIGWISVRNMGTLHKQWLVIQDRPHQETARLLCWVPSVRILFFLLFFSYVFLQDTGILSAVWGFWQLQLFPMKADYHLYSRLSWGTVLLSSELPQPLFLMLVFTCAPVRKRLLIFLLVTLWVLPH